MELSEDYPLTAPLLMVLPARRMPLLVRDFMRFFESAEADRVIRRLGFVNHAITSLPLSEQGTRLANAVAAAGDELGLEERRRGHPLHQAPRRGWGVSASESFGNQDGARHTSAERQKLLASYEWYRCPHR